MRNYFEAERVMIPFNKVSRVSKALDKNGKVYSANVFIDGAESATFTDAETTRFITEYRRWLERAEDEELAMPIGNVAVIEE